MIVRVRCEACRHTMMVESRIVFHQGVPCANCGQQVRTKNTVAGTSSTHTWPRSIAMTAVALAFVTATTWGLVAAFSGAEPIPQSESQPARNNEPPAEKATHEFWERIADLDDRIYEDQDQVVTVYTADRIMTLYPRNPEGVDASALIWLRETRELARDVLELVQKRTEEIDQLKSRNIGDKAMKAGKEGAQAARSSGSSAVERLVVFGAGSLDSILTTEDEEARSVIARCAPQIKEALIALRDKLIADRIRLMETCRTRRQ